MAQARNQEGISQTRMATILGYTNHSYLSRVECGKQKPSITMLFKVADVLEIEVKCFFAEI